MHELPFEAILFDRDCGFYYTFLAQLLYLHHTPSHKISQCRALPKPRCWWCRLHSTCVELPLIMPRIEVQFLQLRHDSTSTTFSFHHLPHQRFRHLYLDPRRESRARSWLLGRVESFDVFFSSAFYCHSPISQLWLSKTQT